MDINEFIIQQDMMVGEGVPPSHPPPPNILSGCPPPNHNELFGMKFESIIILIMLGGEALPPLPPAGRPLAGGESRL